MYVCMCMCMCMCMRMRMCICIAALSHPSPTPSSHLCICVCACACQSCVSVCMCVYLKIRYDPGHVKKSLTNQLLQLSICQGTALESLAHRIGRWFMRCVKLAEKKYPRDLPNMQRYFLALWDHIDTHYQVTPCPGTSGTDTMSVGVELVISAITSVRLNSAKIPFNSVVTWSSERNAHGQPGRVTSVPNVSSVPGMPSVSTSRTPTETVSVPDMPCA